MNIEQRSKNKEGKCGMTKAGKTTVGKKIPMAQVHGLIEKDVQDLNPDGDIDFV